MSDIVKPRYYANPVDVEDSPDDDMQLLETNQKVAIYEEEGTHQRTIISCLQSLLVKLRP